MDTSVCQHQHIHAAISSTGGPYALKKAQPFQSGQTQNICPSNKHYVLSLPSLLYTSSPSSSPSPPFLYIPYSSPYSPQQSPAPHPPPQPHAQSHQPPPCLSDARLSYLPHGTPPSRPCLNWVPLPHGNSWDLLLDSRPLPSVPSAHTNPDQSPSVNVEKYCRPVLWGHPLRVTLGPISGRPCAAHKQETFRFISLQDVQPNKQADVFQALCQDTSPPSCLMQKNQGLSWSTQ
jgi:hypothetical protein